MAEKDYSEFVGKKVVVVVQTDGTDGAEIEGTVDTANALGVLLKPKGKTNLQLLELDKIEDIRYAPEKPKSITVKKLQPIQFGQARQHLADRHGYDLAALAEYSEQDAFDFHKSIDHTDPKLAHIHVAKEKSEAEVAVEAVETDDTEV